MRFFEASRAAVVRRMTLLPYLYTLVRHAYDHGVGPLRPMYYDYPHDASAYSWRVLQSQYMLGDSLLVAPVTVAASKLTQMAEWSVWLPGHSGAWYEEDRCVPLRRAPRRCAVRARAHRRAACGVVPAALSTTRRPAR